MLLLRSGTGSRRLGPRPDGNGGNSRKPRNLSEAREVMGISWMTRKELSSVYAGGIASDQM